MNKVHGLSKKFGRVIAEERARQRISQEQLAEAIGSINVYISLLENGLRQPSLNAVILLAESLNIAPAELVSRVCVLLTPQLKGQAAVHMKNTGRNENGMHQQGEEK